MILPLCACGCGKEVSKPTNRFVNGHRIHTQETTDRRAATCLAKYGRSNVSQVKEIQDRKIETSWKNHGTESPNQVQSVKDKKIKASQEHFGTDHPMMVPEIFGKVKKTMKERHGEEFSTRIPKFQEKSRLTSQEHFGTDHPMKSQIVKDHQRQAMNDIHGVDNPSQLEFVKQKKRVTQMLHYGEDHYSKTPEGRMMHRGTAIKFVEEQRLNNERLVPRKGFDERPFIKELQKYTNLFIDNDFRIVNCYPDGYIKELNLVIEYDEPHHKYTYQKKIDIQKDIAYRLENLHILRIESKLWENNKEETLNNILCVINGLIEIKALEDRTINPQEPEI